jgi:hypothetical protein
MDNDLKIVLAELGIDLIEPPGIIETIFAAADAGACDETISALVTAERAAFVDGPKN